MDLRTSHGLVFAWKLKLFCHLFQSQASDISQFLATGRAMILHPVLAAKANCVTIWALKYRWAH
uniref:SINA2 n=1 Tax=Arundo donax TaxID=35708 RepID=A0A0A9ER18_ARUDO